MANNYEFLVDEFKDAGVYNDVTALMSFFLSFIGVVLCIGLVFYLLRAFAVYNMAKSAGVRLPGLAFVPFVNVYTFGAVGEKYIMRDGKKSAKFSVILLIFKIVLFVLYFAMMISFISALISFFADAVAAAQNGSEIGLEAVSGLFASSALSFFTFLVAIAYSVLYYICLWRIYTAFDYQNNTLYLVLSIIFGFLEPIFLFIIRKKQPTFDYRERLENMFTQQNSDL